jgi:hypothetical protein
MRLHDPGCGTCHVLSNRVEDAKTRLDEAVLRMTNLAGAKRSDEFQAALSEMQSLRMECQALREEVERHQIEHEATGESKAASSSDT